jgi:hypothetical protein
VTELKMATMARRTNDMHGPPRHPHDDRDADAGSLPP